MLKFIDITDPNDDLFSDWLDLYETSFPPEEKILVSSFLWILKEKAKGTRADSHIQAVLDEQNTVVAALRYDLGKELGIAYGWYIAVHPDARNRGIGAECFNEVIRRASEVGLRAFVFEVEVPEHFDDPEREELARRRIDFYRRQGALLLGGVRYIQQIRNQPAIPLHIMVVPIEPIAPQEALEMAQKLFDNVTQVGELTLE